MIARASSDPPKAPAGTRMLPVPALEAVVDELADDSVLVDMLLCDVEDEELEPVAEALVVVVG